MGCIHSKNENNKQKESNAGSRAGLRIVDVPTTSGRKSKAAPQSIHHFSSAFITSSCPPMHAQNSQTIQRTTSTLWMVPNGMKADLNPAAVALSANPPTYTTLLDVMATCASCCGCGGCGG
jgi:hypothetical protein